MKAGSPRGGTALQAVPRATPPSGRWSLTIAIALGLGLGATATGCASAPGGPSSTRLTADDLREITAQMATKLRASDFLGTRTPDSPPITVAIQRVSNLSSDVIPVSEQWWLMERVRNSLPIVELGKDRNFAFLIPAERLEELRALGFEAGVGSQRNPTHVMDAVFRSVTRSADAARTDLYMCEYRITDITSGELAWADSFEFKRAAFGRSWD
jgi:hypothetical protein